MFAPEQGSRLSKVWRGEVSARRSGLPDRATIRYQTVDALHHIIQLIGAARAQGEDDLCRFGLGPGGKIAIAQPRSNDRRTHCYGVQRVAYLMHALPGVPGVITIRHESSRPIARSGIGVWRAGDLLTHARAKPSMLLES